MILGWGFLPTFPRHTCEINNLDSALEAILACAIGAVIGLDSQIATFAVGGCVAPIVADVMAICCASDGASGEMVSGSRQLSSITQSFILLKQLIRWILTRNFVPTIPGHVSKISNLAKHLEKLLAGVCGVLDRADSQNANFAVGGCVAGMMWNCCCLAEQYSAGGARSN